MRFVKLIQNSRGRDNTTLYWILIVLVMLVASQMAGVLKRGSEQESHTAAKDLGFSSRVISSSSLSLSDLTIDSITYEQEVVRISGITGLPDGAQLRIRMRPAEDRQAEPLATFTVEVKSNAFYGFVSPELSAAETWTRFLIEIIFDPLDQAECVLEKTGKYGENLDQELAVDISGRQVLIRAGELTLSPASVRVDLPSITSYAMDTSERVCAAFLRCWKDGNWEAMINYTGISFREKIGESPDYLEGLFASIVLLRAGIVETLRVSENEAYLVLDIGIQKDGVKQDMRCSVHALKEHGIWGIDPGFVSKF